MAQRKKGTASDDGFPGASATPIEVRFAQAQLNPRRRELVRAILDNPGENFFLSSRELARRFEVDAATIVRTIQALGYDRFADFAADLRRHFVTRITPYTVMKAAAREHRSLADQIRHSVERDSENLSVLKSSLDIEGIIELAKLIHRSRHIIVVGVDLAASLAWFLAYCLTPLGLAGEAPIGSSGNLRHRIDMLNEKDLLIAISFGRCLRETVEAVQRANRRGATTFGITDSDTTPIARYSDKHLVATVASPSMTGSYAAPLSLLNAILITCAHYKERRSLALMRQWEKEYTSGSRWFQEPARRGKQEAAARPKKPVKQKAKSSRT
ncbi:MAG: hypothetical protein DMF61_11110 [Blastocatellia bacterium AA13]|nr:MAG: hypothetical protein DMF61_11110 [Blastocatellia bacterium AA13]